MDDHKRFFDHKGYKMRSHTERVWACLMDALGILYLYEPDLIQVEGCKYLPDFYLPNCGAYLEVKGDKPTADEVRKAEQVREATGKPVVFLVAKPCTDKHGFCNCYVMAQNRLKYYDVSLHDLDQIYMEEAGERAWYKALASVGHKHEYDCVQISSAMEDYMLNIGDRNRMEIMLRQRNKELNAARMAEPHELSIAEQGIKWWVENRA